MATTAIWDVTDRLKRVLDYARNPDKTTQDRAEPDSLQQALGYATADAKTERQLYVSGINCDPLTAYEQMQRTKRQFQKKRMALSRFTDISRSRRAKRRRKLPMPSGLGWRKNYGENALKSS